MQMQSDPLTLLNLHAWHMEAIGTHMTLPGVLIDCLLCMRDAAARRS